MKGPSGFERVPGTIVTVAANPVLVAAPGVGWSISVFKIQGSTNVSTPIRMQDSAAVNYWQDLNTAQRPFYDRDECGLFTLPDNEPLMLANTAPTQCQLNWTYEIRPTGM